MDLEEIGAVLELVLLALDLPWELSGLAHRDEGRAEPVSDGRGDDEAPRFDTEDTSDLGSLEVIGDEVNRRPKRVGVCEQGRDVLEDHARLREVGDVADAAAAPVS